MNETTALRTLTERLLGWAYLYYIPDYNPAAPHAQIVAGALPNDLPVAVPLPEDALVIGSVQAHSSRPPGRQHVPQIHILFDTPQSVEEIRIFYHTCLDATGWTLQQRGRPTGGFVAAPAQTHVRELFCYGAGGPALWLNIHPQHSAPTQVHLELDTTPQPAGCASGSWDRSAPPVLPALRVPASARYVHGGWGGGGGSQDWVHAEMTIQAPLDLVALRAHFDAQLAQAGWAPRGVGQDGALTWSRWSFGDGVGGTWQGALHIVRRPERADQFLLHLDGERAG